MHFRYLKWTRFRLRTLLLVMTLACLLLGTIGVELQNARRSRLLFEQLNDLTIYEPPWCESRRLFGKSVDEIPVWSQLTNLLDEPFLRLRVVHLRVTRPITNEILSQIPRALPCEHLYLSDCSKISDEGLESVCRIPALHSLILWDLDVSGKGLAQLGEAKQLKELWIKGSKINDSTVEYIRELSSVQKIELIETSLTDAGLRSVAEMPNLSYLFISNSQISDAQVEVISKMSSLQCLDLCGVNLQNEQLSQLTKLPSLKYLELYNNPISDDGLKAVEKMEQLVWLDLRKTQVSDAGKERLRQALSGLEIRDTPENPVAEPRPHWRP